MRNTITAAIFAFAGLGALAVPASAQPYGPYDNGYDQPYAADPYNGYCDPNYDCPDDYYDLPLYYGDVYYDGGLYNGPFYYRDYGGRRQFWRHGNWHYGDFRGGQFGPALGRDFYRGHEFGNRGFTQRGNFGGQDYARHAYQPQQTYQDRGYGGGHTWNRGGNFGGGQNWNRGGNGQDYARHAYQPQQSAPVQPFNGARDGNRFSGQSSFQQQAPQAAPQTRSFEGHGHEGGGWRRDHQ